MVKALEYHRQGDGSEGQSQQYRLGSRLKGLRSVSPFHRLPKSSDLPTSPVLSFARVNAFTYDWTR